jgi:pullulanase
MMFIRPSIFFASQPMPSLLERKQTHFILWRPGAASSTHPVELVIGQFDPGPPAALRNRQVLQLSPSPLSTANDLWEIPAASCHLADDMVYHYWFQLPNTNPYGSTAGTTLCVTDPTAATVDWRLTSTVPAGDHVDAIAAAAVIRFRNGLLVPTDPEVAPSTFSDVADSPAASLPTNMQLVIYELPTAWTKTGDLPTATNVGVGTFQDVLALVRHADSSPNFPSVPVLRAGNAYLQDLGINALELLPPADSYNDRRSWGYATSNYFAPDFDLGRPLTQPAPTATRDFLNLIRGCHAHGIRFFYDSVMAFSDNDPYRTANFLDFHVKWDSGDPEQAGRDGFGGDLWKYVNLTRAYDPVSGVTGQFYPARQHLLAHMHWWMTLYRLDGYRLDSVNNVKNYDFIDTFRTDARNLFRARWQSEGHPANDPAADAHFLTIGEELSEPSALLPRIDALWNDKFRNRVRNAIIGRNGDGQPSFEWTVREMIDCRNLPGDNGQSLFHDGAQAVNYIGSHDLANQDGDTTDNDRLYNFLDRFGVGLKDKPIRLAFVCLLTAVGIPMILAGDEFAQSMNFALNTPNLNDAKQIDPINYDLPTSDLWRASVLEFVTNLIKFRTSSAALSVNDTEFIHVDFTEGKRVLAWQRGPSGQDPVVVVANFSDWSTDTTVPGANYVVNNWPSAPAEKTWREVTQNRTVPAEWVGREPIFAWEAKVYTTT